MSKVEYQLLEPEERQKKWEPVSHRYALEGSKDPINEVVMDEHPHGSRDVLLGMDVPESRRDHVIQTTRALLNEAGYTEVQFKTYNSSSFSAKISGIKDEMGILDVVSALSSEAKMEDGVTAYPVLPREVARDIAVMEMDRLAEGNGNLYGPLMGGYQGELANYVDVVTRDTQAGHLLGIDFIRENSLFAETTEIYTELNFSDVDAQKRTIAALQKAGVTTNVEHGMVIADDTIDGVGPVMTKAGLLPSSMLAAIESQVRVMRPDVNAGLEVGEPVEQ